MSSANTPSVYRTGFLTCLACLGVIFGTATGAAGATVFDTDFTGTDGSVDLHPELLNSAGDDYSLSANAVVNPLDFNVSGNRDYVRTIDSDYINGNYVMELTVKIDPGLGAFRHAAIGIGTGTPNPNWYNTPNQGFDVEMLPSDSFSGLTRFRRVDTMNDAAVEESVFGSGSVGTGTHRVRILKGSGTLQFQIDQNYTGTFSPDLTSSLIDLTSPANDYLDGTNSRFFFGGGSNVTFDDLRIAGPSTVVGVNFLGEGFTPVAPGVYQGLGAAPDAPDNTAWNAIQTAGSGNVGPFNNLLTSSAAPGDLALEVLSPGGVNSFTPGGNPAIALFNGHLNTAADGHPDEMRITGLDPGGWYDLYFYSARAAFGAQETTFVVGLESQTLQSSNTSSLVLNDNYVVFRRIAADASGAIEFSFNGPGGGVFSALQVKAVPEPSSMLLLAVGLVGLLGYRRCRLR